MVKTDFNDGWEYLGKPVMIPHDAMLESGRSSDSQTGSAGAYFNPGTYEYTKKFTAPEEWKDKRIILEFEGIYKNSKVYLNGKNIGGCAYGYSNFFVNLNDPVCGKENELKVTADNSDAPNSRWYTGGGIYRPVNLYVGEKECIEPDTVKVDILSVNPAKIKVSIADGLKGKAEILDNNKVIAKGSTGEEIEIKDGQLWDEFNPYLYTCRVTLPSGDSESVRFGLRMVEVKPGGLFVNGKRTLLRGGCIHHDNGILGAKCLKGAERRKIKILKDAGYNAVRSAHNPCSKALLDACDELGMYVMDESWDMWFNHKSKYDYACDWRDNYLTDLKLIVMKDYNHPSVILYSVGNEVSEPAKKEGIEKTREMVQFLHDADSSRPVTAGFNLMIIVSSSKGKGIYDEENGGQKNDNSDKTKGMSSTMFNMITNMVGTGMNQAANSGSADKITSPALDSLDIAGYNYASGRYSIDAKVHPDRVIFGSETFPQDIAKNWDLIKKYPNVAGDFMWTAWDYLGEAGIGAWGYTDDCRTFNKPYPWLLADTGAFDILGNPGAPVALARAAWGLTDKPWIGVQPVNHANVTPAKSTWRGSNAVSSYSWAGCDGNKMTVEVYGDGTSCELYQNGKKMGKKKMKGCRAVFKGKYIPGKLEAVLYDGKTEKGRSELVSGEGDTKIGVTCEKYDDLIFADISIVNAGGTVESNGDENLTVKVKNGTLLGFGSANPRTEDDYLSGSYRTYYGKALAVIKPGKNTVIAVSSDSGKTAEVKL